MKKQFQNLNLEDRLNLFIDGQSTLNYFENLLVEPLTQFRNPFDPSIAQPVALLILDVNLPVITGLEVCSKVKEIYTRKQKELNEKSTDPIQLHRPLIIFYSSLDYNGIEKFCFDHEKADLFVQKPFTQK